MCGVLAAADATSWRDLYDEATGSGPEQVLARIHDTEEVDPYGRRWPRSKRHDDKTLVTVQLGPLHIP